VHHANAARSVRERLIGVTVEPFVLDGDDWFELADDSRLSWKKILNLVESQHGKLEAAIADLGAGRVKPLDDVKPFDLVLGIK
jgi:hypothetical protein